MLLEYPLAHVFGGSTARALDVVLRGEQELTTRQIATLAGLSAPTASKALRALEAAGVVESRAVGRAITYRANEEHFAFDALLGVHVLARRLESELVRLITEVAENDAPTSIVVFGSRARGAPHSASDIDLLLIVEEAAVERWRDRSVDLEAAMARLVGTPVDVVVSAPPTAHDLSRQFWKSVVDDGQVLAGVAPNQKAR